MSTSAATKEDSSLPPPQSSDKLKLPLELIRMVAGITASNEDFRTLVKISMTSSTVKQEVDSMLNKEKESWKRPQLYGKDLGKATKQQRKLVK